MRRSSLASALYDAVILSRDENVSVWVWEHPETHWWEITQETPPDDVERILVRVCPSTPPTGESR